ncbi:hypothetical protein DEVEQU_00824 [Devosia equisanguinis]|uniref:UPF0102 protein DEVEQU_00824 n=1 Tax=Devosia equisanguinis TaxID=2490941 RepID=A0A447I879_9HYPH|nr:YraN family protein [Devosia equisanguinis]VDS03696.1 hypothetical protein DEVEQU_00824 [Devosia equisanguinis]
MPRSPSRPKADRRIAAQRSGQRGEALAALYLQASLHRIRDRRFKTPMGEIDLVAERSGTIIFVEVKMRSRGDAEEEAFKAVNRERIVRAAQYWLARHPAESGKDFRFDVIFLARGRWPRHLINAFPAF